MKTIGGLLVLWLLVSSCAHKVTKSFLSITEVEHDSTVIAGKSPCDNFMNYAPDPAHPEYTPMRYIRVRFFIVRHDEHDRQFDLDVGSAFIKMMLYDANIRLGNIKMNLPPGNNTPVLPPKYQYYLYPDPNDSTDTGIKMIVDSSLAWFNKKGTINGNYDTRLFDKYATHSDSVLNIFMLEHHPDSVASPTYNSGVGGVGFPKWLKLEGYAQAAPPPQWKDGKPFYENHAFTAALMNHELGHTLGLSHTWSGNDGCNDTPNNPNCWDHTHPACKDINSGLYSNNMMDYNNQQMAITPCQIAKMQYNLSRDNSTVRRFLLPVWCHYKPEASVVIPSFETITWAAARELESDIIIENNATLVIQCRISLPQGAKVIIKPGGTLHLEGGTITNLCGTKWEGIEIWKTKNKAGKVVLGKDAQLLNVKNGL